MNARQKAKKYKRERDVLHDLYFNPKKLSPIARNPRMELEQKRYVSLLNPWIFNDWNPMPEERILELHARNFAKEFEKIVPEIMEIEQTEIGSRALIDIWVKKKGGV